MPHIKLYLIQILRQIEFFFSNPAGCAVNVESGDDFYFVRQTFVDGQMNILSTSFQTDNDDTQMIIVFHLMNKPKPPAVTGGSKLDKIADRQCSTQMSRHCRRI